ncbi:MAG TPA: DUF4105 domain-containing protein [Candidatus Krumholzibacterium sp.]|nr:DUF4105 domain-containing protein [Candidatus Krumholzibacterium sp.]
MKKKWAAAAAAVVVVVLLVAWFSIRPSVDRVWASDQARQPHAEFDGDIVRISNVRNFDHCPATGKTVERWEERTFDLSKLESVWMTLSLFKKKWRGPAHPIMSFGFSDSTYLAVSVEARRESHESYATWKGIAKRFELTYVVADEAEIIKLRTVCRHDRVYLFPIDTSPEKGRKLLREMLERGNELAERPEFYNTIWRNCTTAVIDHATSVADKPIPGGIHSILPGYSDKVVYSLGLIEGEGSLDEIRARYCIDEKAALYADDPRFSTRIRQGL